MSTYGKDRAKIYDYLEKQGLRVTEPVHEALKVLLIDYVNHQNTNLKAEADAWRHHQKKCELFLARKKARPKISA